MLEINTIKKNPDLIIKKLEKRGVDVKKDINLILELNNQRIENQQKLDSMLAEGNQLAQNIGQFAKEKKFEKIEELKKTAAQIKIDSKELIELAKSIDAKIKDQLIRIPNIPHDTVPEGKDSLNNIVIESWEKEVPRPINKIEKLLPHWELAEKYDIIDFKTGSQITGSGFPVYKNLGAKLQRGLINFFLDYNTSAGYTEYIPPYFVNEDSAFNTGQLPDKEGMMYHINNDNLYAIPTAEVPVTNMFKNTRYNHTELPIRCTAYSPCFRREAGSYGKEVRGLNRLHQFDKVEIVQICDPKNSYAILEEMVQHVSKLLKELGLKFRIVQLCGGDLGFTSALTYDFEVYSVAQKKWLEVSSVSNFETYQANRLNLKCVNEEKKSTLCHTLNGSSLALPRIVATILEQNQKENSITMPIVLHKYLGFDSITI